MALRMLLSFVCCLVMLTGCSKDDNPTAEEAADTGGPSWPLTQTADLLSVLTSAAVRQGEPPQTSKPVPHQQLNQNAPVLIQEDLLSNIGRLPGVTIASTTSSLAGSWGWYLEPSLAKEGGGRAFLGQGSVGREFGHSHNVNDGSMHLFLPPDYAKVVLDKGWGEAHPNTNSIAGTDSFYVMIYGPRDRDEREVIWKIVQTSYAYATGKVK